MSNSDEKIRKMPLSIYRIDREEELIDWKDFEETIKIITSEDTKYQEQKNLKSSNIRLYYNYWIVPYTKWNEFFKDELPPPSNFLEQEIWKIVSGSYLSFVCFFEIWNEIFVVTSWKGYLLLEKWCEQYFWLQVITRLLDKNSPALKSLSENSLVGANFESISYFRDAESFISQDDFWKIIKTAITELNEEQLAKVWIDSKIRQNPKVTCISKNHFSPKTGISWKELMEGVLPSLEKLMKEASIFELNWVSCIRKKDSIYEDLEKKLYQEMFSNFKNFDFFPPKDIDDFFHAYTYKIDEQDVKVEDFDLTYTEKIAEVLKVDTLTFEEFKKKLITYITAYDDTWTKVQNSFALRRWLHGQIMYWWQTYFWLNGKFWSVKQTVIDNFNEKALQVIQENKLDNAIILPLKDIWENQNEGPYNDSHKDNFIVLDKKRIHDIEFCDLIYFHQENTYIVHVKKWFDRDMRALSSQILTSARLLEEIRNWHKDDTFFKTLYSKITTDLTITETEFCNLFWKGKNIYFILAYTTEKSLETIEDVKKIRSNIAKLELFETFKDFKKFSSPQLNLRIKEIMIKTP